MASGLSGMVAIAWPRVMPVAFTHPLHLLWLPPAIALLVWLSRRSYADLSPARRRAALGVRIGLVCAVVLALAGAQTVRGSDALCTVFVLDVSESVSEEAQARALAYIEESTEKMRRDDEAALVVFGSDAYVELAPGPRRKVKKIASAPSPTHTDLAAALRLALAAFPEGMAKRIVVLSDGNETAGNAVQQALVARSQEVPIDVVPLGRDLPGEVLLERAVLPAEVKRGEPFELRLIASATGNTVGTVRAFRDGKYLGDYAVKLAPGKNVLTFPQRIDEPGFHSYDLVIGAEGDALPQNNRALGFVQVKREKPRLLYVDGRPEDARFVRKALEANDIEVAVAGPEGIPTSLAELQDYDGVIYSDLVAWASTPEQMQMVQSSVRDLGMGFGMVGGEHAFGAGGYFDTPIEETLPVEMSLRKQRALPSTAIMIVVDKSGSMGAVQEGVEKIALAAEAAVAVVNLLQPIDQLGVMATDTAPKLIVPVTPIANKQQIVDDVFSMRAGGGGIVVLPSLERARRELEAVEARTKHVILLADGSDCEQQGGCEDLAAQMARKKITITAVAIGAGPDVPFLERVAKAGKGNFYLTEQARDLPRIFTRDALVVAKSLIVEKPFVPRVDPEHECLKGVDWSETPPLLGYVTTTPKSLAAVGMQSPSRDPVFASWRYGLGRSVAFTSDAKARWGARWLDWPEMGRFWAQAVRWMMRRSARTNLQLLVSEEGGQGKVRVDAFDEKGEFLNFLPLEGRVIAPGRRLSTRTLRLDQTGPGRYEGSFEAGGVGTYLVDVRKQGDAGGETATLVVSYPAEYRETAPNQFLLGRLAQATGGRLKPKPEAVFAGRRAVARHFRDIWAVLAGIALGLLPFDVALRRLMIDPSQAVAAASRAARRVRVRRRRRPQRQGTMDRLLRVKQRARGAPEEVPRRAEGAPEAKEAPPPPEKAGSEEPPLRGDDAAPADEAEGPPAPAEERPMSRLLGAKRRAKR